MTRIRKSVGRGRLVSTRLMTTLTMVVGLLVPASGAVFAAVDGVPGSTLDPFTQTELDTNWEADRYFPTDGVTSVSAFGRDDVARIGIDSTDTQPGTFQRTEGIKTVDTGFFGRTVQVDLYLDPGWADKVVRAGVWVVGDNGSGARDNFFGIIEFLNMEPCPEPDCTNQTNIPDPAHEGFRVYDSTIGWSEYLATPFNYGEWVTLEITLDAAAGEYIYSIDGVEVATAVGGSHFISEVFLNSYNFGEDSFPTLLSDDYAAHWHVGSESEITWTTEVVYPGDMKDWAFGFDSGTDGSGEMVWGPGLPPAGGGSAFFELGDAATGYVLGTQGHDLAGMAFMDITALEYSTFRAAGGAAQAVALQFNVDYDLTDADTSWQGRLVYEPYYTQTVETGEWQTWDTLTTGANWWSTGTPKVGDAVATKHCLISDPCTWEEVLSYYPDAGIHELPLGAVTLKAGSAWAGFEGNADELKIATGTTGTIFDFDPFAGLPCVVDWAGGGDFTTLADAIAQPYCTEIKVAAGTYAEGPQVVISRDLTIVGEDRATTILNPTANTGTSGDARGWFLVQAGANVDVSNVTFDGTGFAIWQAFRSHGSGTIDTVAFVNIAAQATGSPYNGIGVVAFGPMDVTDSTFQGIGRVGASYFGAGTGTFSGNTYTGKGVGDHIDYGVEVGGGAQVTIADSTFSGNRGVAVTDGSGSAGILVSTYFGAGSAASITGNSIQDNSTGVYIGFNAADSSAVELTGNEIIGNNYGVVLASGATAAAAASSANRNEITGNSTRGVWTDVAFDATCNWWGDHWGPSGSGPGGGDSVTVDVGFLPWLITGDLAGECGGGIDTDRDGVFDMVDNCPFVKNPGQADHDGDGVGDVCDPDIDGDGVANVDDAYPYDPAQWELDTDGDGVPDAVDNCAFVSNRSQADHDGDGVGDACDPDIDGDGVANVDDAYPYNPNRWDLDSDGDGVPDAVDNCPFVRNRGQADHDGDGVGDVCDPDIDGDGVPNDEDFYPYNPNKWEKDRFWSGDSDRDGIPDDVDNCPFVRNPSQADHDGDGVGDACDPDIDGDGVANELDAYPYDPARWELDTDGDGVLDAVDNCPFMRNRGQWDMDGDGVGNACDPDIDGDGVANGLDAYPYDPARWELDTDGDGVPDAVDNCPFVRNSGQWDLDGDGVGNVCDPDIDGDGVANQLDADPYDPIVW